MRPEKQQIVADISGLIESSNGMFLITYQGLTTQGFETLRNSLSEAGGECHVVPNRLFKKAADQCGLEEVPSDILVKDTALVVSRDDLVGVAKVLRSFKKDHGEVAFKLAVAEGRICSAEEAESLADLPTKEVLQAQLLGLLNAPAGQLVGVLNAKLASVVYLLSAYLSEKEQAA